MAEQQQWQIAAAQAYGAVLINARGEILLREPSNHFDGYVWTFAKGKPDANEQPADTALRELYEETGYRARIIGVLPGVFESGNSSSAFFLMRAEEGQRQEAFSWETQQIQWFSFSQAKARVALSTNKLGRQRDLAILDAAERWFLTCLPLCLLGKFPAVKTDWQTEALPGTHSRIELNLTFSRMQAAALMQGAIPEEMEEKWFSYFDNNVLYQHRSWTGVCIDEIHLTELADGSFRATHALVNRNPEQYAAVDDKEDKKRIKSMLESAVHIRFE
ncbi:NUDIX hydrolase [Rheinheimera marina]|uniref:NUDIX hydrolase n=1 Tax=Rheinheimera marina TaxID=1774958 RepID=A0ABV9JHS1_9GAMM